MHRKCNKMNAGLSLPEGMYVFTEKTTQEGCILETLEQRHMWEQKFDEKYVKKNFNTKVIVTEFISNNASLSSYFEVHCIILLSS